MASVISFVQQKGGTGKTTSTLNVAGHLARRGRKTLVVDLDPQASATTGSGVSSDSVEENMYDVLIDRLDIRKIIVETGGDYHLAPAGLDLVGADAMLHRTPGRTFFALSEALAPVRNFYDFILVDVPPGSGVLAFNAVEALDLLLVPFDPGIFALESFQSLEILLQDFGKLLKRKIRISGAVLTRWKRVSTQWEPGETLNELSGQLTERFGRLFTIPFTNKIYEAQLAGLPISHFSPSSRASLAYEEIAKYIEEKVNEG